MSEHDHDDEPCVHEQMVRSAFATGTVFGSLVGALDSAGEQPIAVDSGDLGMAGAMSHAFIDGFLGSFRQAVGYKEGTDWRVSAFLMPPVHDLHAMVAILGQSLDELMEKMEEAGQDENTERVIIGRGGDATVTLGLLSEDSLDEAILGQVGQEGPPVRFVGLMDHFGVDVASE